MEIYQNYRLIAQELSFTMEKLWYFTENYGTLIYYGKNYGIMGKKNYGTIVNYS